MDSDTVASASKHRTDVDGAGRTDGVPVALTVATTIANLLLASPSPGLAATSTATAWAVTTETAAQQPYLVYGTNLSSLAYLDANTTASLYSPFPVGPSASTPAPTGPPDVTVSTIVISIILLAVIVGTVIGNVLVCVAVCLVRKLRRPCNYLLVSLAISDLCVALLVMPMALLYEVLEEWRFGEVFCDIWVAFDVLSCTASILNLCAISVDRYWAITKPLEYGVKRTPRRMIACIVLVWLAAACISLPPLLILGNEHEINGQPACSVCQNFFYQIYATLGSFYIPLAVMLFVYFQIFRAARRIVMEEKRAQKRLESAINGATQAVALEKKPPGMVGEKVGPPGKVTTSSPQNKRLRFQLAKERKASTTLGIIMSAFTICWLPFFILALVRPFMKDDHRTLSSFFLWLGYANSLLNPIIYATLNRDFRKPFQEILYFRCSSLNNMMREDFYHSQYGDPGSQRLVITNDGGARESFL
ncbi:AGAP004223-PA [Anopheles gambiae str. PEST]|uniref:AGAP004223-PA n=2 Tax=gambiae species complex TaxID=44542 RepID=Q7QB24_ANOGA|nr:5-hydroxytryptamine receptor 1 isoform X2 [Anopheles gambiae]XP_061497509.1 5-hydroxytryptamine receptor 1 isoform X2 [Anopheles gambiae]XP_061497510.1 5-hydroxytryptamine receptor 1 isoform X2 [Anopheles gambiae]XP_061497511.1 5-hydroxytryptamine receptor 1 isoform X2 [Anopheles gambiae]XP_061497512.1 5-hydroxytryptamine receptor 1 isoform X2 [Anopheles gambiae]XP_061497513.1 5-hydroxytryptamine receptor 1 isoform X2 [Anopheles gambiae]XP_061497514.1 5-hydroxytryptamine receptor 1 isoform